MDGVASQPEFAPGRGPGRPLVRCGTPYKTIPAHGVDEGSIAPTEMEVSTHGRVRPSGLALSGALGLELGAMRVSSVNSEGASHPCHGVRWRAPQLCGWGRHVKASRGRRPWDIRCLRFTGTASLGVPVMTSVA